MGILERIEQRLIAIETKLGVTTDLTTLAAAVNEAVEAPAAPLTAPALVTEAGEVDSAGVVWSADFHAGTKRKNADGTWSAKKGVDKAALAAYSSKFSNQTVPADSPAAMQIDHVGTTTAPAIPAIPDVPAIPSIPAIPAVPTAPVVELQTPAQIEAIKHIQQLTDHWKVPYQSVVNWLLASHGASSFETLSVQFHPTVAANAKLWNEALFEIDDYVARLTDVGDKTGQQSAITGTVSTVLASVGNGAKSLGELGFDVVSKVATALNGYTAQWEAYAKNLGK